MLSDSGWNCFKHLSVRVNVMLSSLIRAGWSSTAGGRRSLVVSDCGTVDSVCWGHLVVLGPSHSPRSTILQGHSALMVISVLSSPFRLWASCWHWLPDCLHSLTSPGVFRTVLLTPCYSQLHIPSIVTGGLHLGCRRPGTPLLLHCTSMQWWPAVACQPCWRSRESYCSSLTEDQLWTANQPTSLPSSGFKYTFLQWEMNCSLRERVPSPSLSISFGPRIS